MMRKWLILVVLFASLAGGVPQCAVHCFGFQIQTAGSHSKKAKSNDSFGSGELLVLKNGQVIRGRIDRNVESVQVQTDTGSRLVIPIEEVDFVAPTLEQAYWQKSARTRATDLTGQIDLFYWCLRNQLLRQAQNQIDLLQETSIKASELEFLHRQLEVAQADKKREARLRQAQAELLNRSGNVPSATVAGSVRQVAYEMDATTAHDFQRIERIKRMERVIDELPEGAVAMFKRQVEPTLIRACSDCHESDDPVMPLWRMGRNQVIPRTMSQRNLQSLLEQIRAGDPARSPLWLAATQSHAELEKPLLKPGTRAYSNLAQWVHWMALQKNQRAGAAAASSIMAPAKTVSPSASSFQQPAKNESPELEAIPPTIPSLKPKRLPKAASPDPFDPTEFNETMRIRTERTGPSSHAP